MSEKEVGKVTNYFSKVQVAAIDVTGRIKKGDNLRIKGHATDLSFVVESMQIDKNAADEVGPGDQAGIRVPGPVRKHDLVMAVTED